MLKSFHRLLHHRATVKLNSIHFKPSNGLPLNHAQPIVVHVHGAFGSAVDFQYQSKKLANSFQTMVYSVDLRNHGESPRALPYDNWTLTNDLVSLINTVSHQNGNKKVDLIGFSLGAKLALLAGFQKKAQTVINKIVSIDMPPGKLQEMDIIAVRNFKIVLDVLRAGAYYKQGKLSVQENKIHETNGKHFSKADLKSLQENLFLKTSGKIKDWMRPLENHFGKFNNYDPNLIAYFTAGFREGSLAPKVGEPLQHKIPLLKMPNYLNSICDWPTSVVESGNPLGIRPHVSQPTLFLRALQSPMFPLPDKSTQHHYDLIEKYYPNHRILDFDCIHPIHIAKPLEYYKAITDFLKVNQKV